MEKEREARRKAGLPETREQYISPRQQRLGAFVGLGQRGREGADQEDIAVEDPPRPTARSPLQAKSLNAVVKSRDCAASRAHREIDVGCTDDVLPCDSRVVKELLLPSIATITPIIPNKGSLYMVEKTVTAQVEYTTELLGLISTQDLQSSDDDSSSSSSSHTILGDEVDHHQDGGDEEEEEDSDFADADFEELAQDLEFGPLPAMPDRRQNLNPKEKAPPETDAPNIQERSIQTPQPRDQEEDDDDDDDDTLFDEFAPLSQDLLDLAEMNEFDDGFEISTQDIRFLDP